MFHRRPGSSRPAAVVVAADDIVAGIALKERCTALAEQDVIAVAAKESILDVNVDGQFCGAPPLSRTSSPAFPAAYHCRSRPTASRHRCRRTAGHRLRRQTVRRRPRRRPGSPHRRNRRPGSRDHRNRRIEYRRRPDQTAGHCRQSRQECYRRCCPYRFAEG